MTDFSQIAYLGSIFIYCLMWIGVFLARLLLLFVPVMLLAHWFKDNAMRVIR